VIASFNSSISSFVFLWINPSLLEYLRWFCFSDFSLTGSCEFLQVDKFLACFRRFVCSGYCAWVFLVFIVVLNYAVLILTV